jgi:cadherin EGF LAG seven-pass G-type receptor 1
VAIASDLHTLSIVLVHHPHSSKPDDHATLKRIRRELQNQSPHFDLQSYSVRVPEERERGYLVTTLNAVDPEGTPVSYSMSAVLDARSQNQFVIDARSGVVTTSAKLDREIMDQHFFRVTAVDAGQPPMTATTILRIYVDDVNDHPPLFEQAVYESKIRESVPIGSTSLTVRARDQDAGDNGRVEYSLVDDGSGKTGDNGDFRIDSKTGVISTRLPLDREVTSRYDLVVLATDKGGTDRKSSTATVVVSVLDDNDNYPQFDPGTSLMTVTVPENIDYASKPVIANIR